MISLWLEKILEKAQATVLGVEYDYASLATVKLNKTDGNYSLANCDSQMFSPEAYFEKNFNYRVCWQYFGKHSCR